MTAGILNIGDIAGALTGTSSVAITGGTLLLSGSASNRINNSATVSLGGAAATTLRLGAAAGVTEAMGALTLSSGAGTRVIDFGSASGALTFASIASQASAIPLQIWNWTAGTDTLTITTASFGTNITGADISFFSGANGTGPLGTAVFSGSNLVPVPEIGGVFAALGLLAPLAYRERRHWMRCREAR